MKEPTPSQSVVPADRQARAESLCPFCGREKIALDFCCSTCWKRLPNWIRALFVRAKNRARGWLRANPEQSNPQAPSRDGEKASI